MQLQNRLRGARRVAIVGIGSEIRGDDACGMLVAQEIQKHLALRQVRIKVFLGSTAPENLTGEIKKFRPTHIVMVDAAQIKKPRTQALLFTPEEIDAISFCTHRLPLSVMAAYLKQSFPCEVVCIGVQPRSIVFNKPISPEMKKRVTRVSDIIIEALNICDKRKKEIYA